jgi:NADH-quinone oxidoreductase subunit C
MNNLKNELCSRFTIENTDIVTHDQIAFDVENNELHSLVSCLKSMGWKQLSMITCIDWIDEGHFQLVYILFNWENPIRIQVRTRVERDNPVFRTITTIFNGAKYYERDVHEFFGIEFVGNPDSKKQLFLENWDDMPPLRKDFDSKAYSDKKYTKREYTTNFETRSKEDK